MQEMHSSTKCTWCCFHLSDISVWAPLSDVHHQYDKDKKQPPGQTSPLPGYPVRGVPHRPEPCLRVPEPLLRRHHRIHSGKFSGSVFGKKILHRCHYSSTAQ